jgi:ABC-type uncharacterized transport system permease subunit
MWLHYIIFYLEKNYMKSQAHYRAEWCLSILKSFLFYHFESIFQTNNIYKTCNISKNIASFETKNWQKLRMVTLLFTIKKKKKNP